VNGKLYEVIDSYGVETVKDEENDKPLGKAVYFDSASPSEQDIVSGGAAVALDWVADMLVERIENCVDNYDIESGPTDEDLEYSTYELLRVLIKIDEERYEDALETVREAGM